MTRISIQKSKITFNKEENQFLGCDKNFPFATSYELVNDKTGKSMTFEFKYSTGAEFDPNTKWVYTNEEKGFSFVVSQDAELTMRRAADYAQYKMMH